LNGIDTGNGTGNTIIGNYIGLGKDGSTIRGNSKNGIYLSSSSNTIGAAGTGPSNVISGNGFYGIQGFGATSNVVTGNYIGTDKTGNNARSNSQDGIYFDSNSSSNTIGGANAQAGNMSSGNSWYGISMRGNSNVIQWNKFGIAANGTQLPNGSGGEDPIQGTGISWSHNSVQNGGSPLFLSLAETDSLDQSSIVSLGRSTLSPPIEGFFEGAEPVVSIADDSSLDGATNSPSPSRLGATSGFQRTGGILREPSSPWLIVTDLGVPVV
jgi:hypothetical protein